MEEPARSGPGSLVYWVAHGTALIHCAPEQLRPELPLERVERLATAPASEVSDSVFRRVARALRPVRGPVRFLDLTTRKHQQPKSLWNVHRPSLESHGASEVEVSRERSRSPARQRPDQMDEVTRRSLDRARAVDGLPPVRDPVRVVPSTWSTNFAESNDDVDNALIAESELREKSFTNEQKAEFDEAKDNALRPWTENQAWRCPSTTTVVCDR